MLGPNDLTADQVQIAVKPTFGGEMKVFLSRSRHLEIGSIEIAAANSGVLTANAAETAALAAAPSELIAVVDGGDLFAGSADLTIAVSGTDENDDALAGTITFKSPAYAAVSDRIFPIGWAVDVRTAGDKKFKTITLGAVTAQADAVGAKVTLFAVPALSSFRLVGCTTDKGFTTKSQTPANVQCGMDESAFVKPGTTKPGELKIKSKWISFAEGLGRFDGIRCTARIDVVKEGKVTSERLFFMGYIPKTDPSAGEGADVGMFDATGNYEDLGIMVAQQAS